MSGRPIRVRPCPYTPQIEVAKPASVEWGPQPIQGQGPWAHVWRVTVGAQVVTGATTGDASHARAEATKLAKRLQGEWKAVFSIKSAPGVDLETIANA